MQVHLIMLITQNHHSLKIEPYLSKNYKTALSKLQLNLIISMSQFIFTAIWKQITSCYNLAPINLYIIVFVINCKITRQLSSNNPLYVKVCSSIFSINKKQSQQKKASSRFSLFVFITLHERNMYQFSRVQ